MNMKHEPRLGTLEGRMNGLEMWCDMDVFNNVNSKEPWWEIRKDGVCVKTGGGSDEAPDAAYAEVLHDLMEEKHGTEEPEGSSTGHYEPSPEELEWEKASEAERMRIAQRCEPSQEEIDQMAEESARLAAERREQESRAPRAVPGSYDQPFKCEDDLPAPVFATVQTALAGRSTLTVIQQLALIKSLSAHGLTLKRFECPHPTSPYFLLWLVSTHLRPASGWYVY